ncbi:MAG: inositol monophosphatase [Bdellovibrionales bacterium]
MVMRPALINVMAKAAEKAGKGLRRDFGEIEHLQVSRKGQADFVSTADLKAQKILREELGKARPSFGFYMEEEDGEDSRTTSGDRWIVDPLDGTTNFLHGVPHWCISIAAERDGEVVAGLIYNPINDEMFWAEKGIGAYCSNQRIRVSGRTDLSECLIATGLMFRGNKRAPADVLKELAAVMPHLAGIRRAGSAALDMAYVAAGRYDGYWECGLGSWDVAAGYLLVKEAGGFVSPMKKGQNPVRDASVIATNSAIHDKIVKLLQQA